MKIIPPPHLLTCIKVYISNIIYVWLYTICMYWRIDNVCVLVVHNHIRPLLTIELKNNIIKLTKLI